VTCPICCGAAKPEAIIPFNKSCEGLGTGGEMIDYWACEECGFTWSPELCAKDPAWFAEHIYNSDYIKFDPEYGGERAARQAKNLIFAYHWARKKIRHLDYGSGDGLLTKKLAKAGFDSTPYDPFVHTEVPVGKFNLITCFEVLEHVPDPGRLMADLAGYLDDEGVLITSTLLRDKDVPLDQWWYAAPRNGHISLYSGTSLGKLAVANGLQACISTVGTHTFHRKLPTWY